MPERRPAPPSLTPLPIRVVMVNPLPLSRRPSVDDQALSARWRDALIVRRDAEIAAGTSDKAGLLWIGTQRPLPRGRRRGEIHPRCNDATRRNAVLNPLDQRTQHVKLIRGGSSAAMTHIRDRVKPGEFRGPPQASVLSRQFVVIVDCAEHWRAGIAQPMIPDDLTVVVDE